MLLVRGPNALMPLLLLLLREVRSIYGARLQREAEPGLQGGGESSAVRTVHVRRKQSVVMRGLRVRACVCACVHACKRDYGEWAGGLHVFGRGGGCLQDR